MKKTILLSLPLLLVLSSPASLAGGAGMPPMGSMSTAQMSNDSDVLFMEVMTISNLAEIQTSQLALKKSSNADVKAFAQKMISDHTKAQAELNALAKSKGVVLTNKPGAAQRLEYNKLTTLSGAEFDAMYKKVQVSGHQMTLDLINLYQTIGKDADALAYAAKTGPIVAMHLDMAKALP
ncbi:hypothetical protein DKM44_13045 [Deinococcus irradiatisoli]|uniref:DUF4142 domain-containing protein n=1 Tax=Deinococcus irradiatisoli TaxID=2202254 RepID=A0A2Z3JRU0_9DEIO|nr:DUF4142 domain-containing protein [Deinococcus irradiatisoli]AWN24048.1 hypothetical protein DKM44_13045 [Deinococcus irradiatisoli]